VGLHSVICHLADVNVQFPPLPQLPKASTWFSDPGVMQDCINLVVLLHTEMVYQPEDDHLTQY